MKEALDLSSDRLLNNNNNVPIMLHSSLCKKTIVHTRSEQETGLAEYLHEALRTLTVSHLSFICTPYLRHTCLGPSIKIRAIHFNYLSAVSLKVIPDLIGCCFLLLPHRIFCSAQYIVTLVPVLWHHNLNLRRCMIRKFDAFVGAVSSLSFFSAK